MWLRVGWARCFAPATYRAGRRSPRDRLFVIAAKIGDPEYRKSFLESVPENRRTLELARQWVGLADSPASREAPG